MTLDPREVAAMLAGAEARRTEPLRPDTREEIQARLTAERPHAIGVCEAGYPTGCGGTCRTVVAALSAAGLLVTPVAEVQYAVRFRDEGDVPIPGLDLASLRRLVGRFDGTLVRRVVSPWEPVPDEEDSGG